MEEPKLLVDVRRFFRRLRVAGFRQGGVPGLSQPVVSAVSTRKGNSRPTGDRP
jgi:hypothetical protein